MSDRVTKITKHGTRWETHAGEPPKCPECRSWWTTIVFGSHSASSIDVRCDDCGCEWTSEPQPSAVAAPIIVEGKMGVRGSGTKDENGNIVDFEIDSVSLAARRIERYEHHGVRVAVRKDLRGKHREHCLCYQCEKFKLEDRDGNCPKANRLYALCVKEGMTTPVWECPDFESRWGAPDRAGLEL